MAHHRCTRCKEESYPRHKWQGGVYCDDCIRRIRGSIPGRRGWLGSLWGKLVDLVERVFQPESPRVISRQRERAEHARFKARQMMALSIPPNPWSGAPQKR